MVEHSISEHQPNNRGTSWPRRKWYGLAFVGFLTLLVMSGTLAAFFFQQSPEATTLPQPRPAGAITEELAPVPVSHPVIIRKPNSVAAISTGTVDEKGQPITLACSACHAIKPVNPAAKVGVPLKQFHQDLIGKHGNLTCTSCHNSTDGNMTLRLADGKSVPFAEVMTLCAQCHGTQFRDYQHGAHGGMTGYWDLTKGGRVRNGCTNCHDPHAPKYPTVSPAPRANDRFLTGGGHE